MNRIPQRAGIVGLAVALLVAAGHPGAQEAGPAAESLRFRRVFVPEDRMKDVVDTNCHPKESEAFEDLLKRAQAATGVSGPKVASLVRAEYSAEFSDDSLIQGRAVLDLASTTTPGQMLPLDSVRLAMGPPTWEGEPPQAAQVGLASDGRVVVMAEQSTRLNFPWSLRGEPTELGDVRFQLHLPPSPTSRLILSLPINRRPVVDAGIVSRAESTPGEDDSSPENPPWIIELGGQSQATLRITATDQWEHGRSLVMLTKQQLRYELSPRGLQLTADLEMDVYYEPLNELLVTLAMPLQLTSARYDNKELEWGAEYTDDAAARLVSLRFPKPLEGVGRKVRLTCLAPIVWDQPWRLPSIQVEDVRWQEGQATLEVPDGVSLKYFHVRQGREAGVEPLPNKGQLRRVQLHGERPQLDVVLSSREAEPELTAATWLHFGGSSVSATTTIELASLWGDVYELTAFVPKAWLIDAVETLTDEPGFRSTVTPATATLQRLHLQLQRPVTPKQSVRFRVRAHREAPLPTLPVAASQLRLVDFRDTPLRRHLWAITTDAGYQVRWKDDVGFEPARPELATAEEREVLPIDSAEWLLRDDTTLRDASFLFVRERPAFSGELLVVATARDNLLVEQYSIRCHPRSTPLRRVVVHLSDAHDRQVTWTLGDEHGTPLPATQQSPAGPHPDGATNGETWEITLPSPQAEPFTIHGHVTTRFEEPRFLSLVSLPEADSQLGRLMVVCDDGRTLTMDGPDLKPIPSDTFDAGRFAHVVGKYRYEPSHKVRVRVTPHSSLDPLVAAWVWRCELATRISTSGLARHQVRLLVENQGERSLTVALPDGAELEEVFVDDREVIPVPDDWAQLKLAVPLPAGVRYPTVDVRYRTQRAPLVDGAGVAAELPGVEVPMLNIRWDLWLPPSYGIAAHDTTGSPTLRWRQGVQQLLFGDDLSTLLEHRFLAWRPFRRDWVASMPGGQLAGTTGLSSQAAEEDLDQPGVPWVRATEPVVAAAAEGWTRHARSILTDSHSAPAVVTVVHGPTRRAYGWAALLVAAAIGWQASRLRIGLTFSLMVLAWSLLIVGPAAWLPIYTGCLLGLVLGLLLVLAVPTSPVRRLVPSGEASTASAIPMLARLLLFTASSAVVVWGTQRLNADEPGEPRGDATKRRPVSRVFVPVDEERQPVGDYVWVPKDLLESLMARAATHERDAHGYLLTSASYEGEITQRADEQSLAVTALTATYEVTTFESDVEVVLPLRRTQTQVTAVQLDDESLPVVWDAAATSISVTIQEAGDYRLAVFMQPRIQASEGSAGFEIQVPPTPRSELSLAHPPAVRDLRFPTAVGQVARRSELGETHVALGGADRLVVQWPAGTTENEPAGLSLDQYLWLQVRPASVLVDARLTYRTMGPPIRFVQLRADPKLQLLPLDDDSPVVDYRIVDGDPRTIRLSLDRPYAREVSLRLRFLWDVSEASEVNSLSFPRLEPFTARIARRWVAVTLPPGTVALQGSTVVGEPLEVGSFATSWGESSALPTLAYSLAGSDSLWSLSLRRQETPETADEQLDVSVGAGDIELAYRARLSAPTSDRFQYRFRVPEGFQVHSAVLRSDVVQRVYPRLDGAGHLTIFLSERPRGEAVVQLLGSVPAAIGQPMPTPLISLVNVSVADQRVRVYRKSDVNVRLQGGSALDLTRDPATDWHAKFGRLQATYEASQASGKELSLPTLRATANRPRLRARTVTELVPHEENWQASLEFLVDVAGGFLDHLRLEVPMEWTDIRADESSPVQLELKSLPGQTRRQLVIRPHEPIRGEYRVRLRGDVPTTTVDALRVPEIGVLGAVTADRFVVLPTDLQRKQIDWEISGLRESELPDDYLFANPELKQHSSFQVVGSRFQAKIQHVERASTMPQVRLADVFIRWDEAGRAVGAVTFDLEPAGLTECRLAVPPGCRLLNVLVDDVPVTVESADTSFCTVPLVSHHLPQRIEIVFLAQTAWQGTLRRQATLSAPMLVDLPVERTLWSVIGDSSDLGGPLQVDGRVTAFRQELYRLESISGLIDMASDVVAEGGVAELKSWYRRWMRRYARSATRLDRLAERHADPDLDVPSLREAVEERQRLLAERLRTAAIRNEVVAQAGQLADMADTAMASWSSDSRAVHCMFLGSHDQVELQHSSSRADQFWKRLTLALVVSGLVVTLAMLRSYLPVAEWAARWPYAVGVLVGLAWWLWLFPSFLGWLIVAISVLGALRLPAASHNWPRVTEHASTVVRADV